MLLKHDLLRARPTLHVVREEHVLFVFEAFSYRTDNLSEVV